MKRSIRTLLLACLIFVACEDLREPVVPASDDVTRLQASLSPITLVPGVPTRLPTGPPVWTGVAIDGNKVAWLDVSTRDIHVYDLSTGVETQIVAPGDQSRPDVSGDLVVYEDYREGSYRIYYYDLATSMEGQVPPGPCHMQAPAVSGVRIAWEDCRIFTNTDIFLYDLATGIEHQITDAAGHDTQPAISGDRIAYKDGQAGSFNANLYVYDVATGVRQAISVAPGHQYFPAIEGDRVVWVDTRSGDADIYMHDLATGVQRPIAVAPGNQWSPDISGDFIVWADLGGDSDIHLYDLSTDTETLITADPLVQSQPAISRNRVVWLQQNLTDPGRDLDVYVYVIPGTNEPPIASPGGPYTGQEGGLVALSLQGSDPDGDALTYTWDLGDGTVGSGSVPPADHAYANDGAYTITLTVDDGNGGVDTRTTSATILNVAPTVAAVSGPLGPVQVGYAITITAGFDDPGWADSHTASIDWGDGVTTAGAVSGAPGGYTSTGSHAYTSAGVYTVTVTVSDDDGGSGSAAFQYAVVFDPEGAFVAGGGRIDSPAGAYAPDPGIEGRASFGFGSRYAPGAGAPEGSAQFRFRVADLTFQSTSYDWLVVAGARAQFKGLGEINGSGSYGFFITAIDGDLPGGNGVDRFRIRIWELTAGEPTIYDNQPGDDLDANATTALAGGSIRITK